MCDNNFYCYLYLYGKLYVPELHQINAEHK